MSEQALFGIETEYAFLAESINDRPYTSLHRNIAAELFPLAQKRFASLPGGNNSGLFLGNGARFYLDAGNHPEYCTPECLTPEEGVRWLLSGDRVLADLVDELGKQHPGFRLALFRCNVDYSGNHAVWGCHESYSIESRQQTLAAALIPHLVSRIVITGAGGFDNLEGRDDSTAPTAGRFLISPRVPHFADTAMWAPGSPRALIHNRCEPLSHRRLDRLHLMCGESLCSQLGNYLKLGCTALVIKLAEAGAPELERLTFHDPLGAMDLYAADPSCTTTAPLLDGRDLSAIQVQRFYLEAAEEAAATGSLPEWAPEVCRSWRQVLDQLEQGPEAVETQLDWAIKLSLFRSRSDASEDRNTRQAKLAEIDTRFGQIGLESIFGKLEAAGALDHQIGNLGSIEAAMTAPPPGGRAQARGHAIAELSTSHGEGSADWDRVMDNAGHRVLDLSDPFNPAPEWRPRRRRSSASRASLSDFHWDNRSEGEAAIQSGYELYVRLELEEAISHFRRAIALFAGEPDECWEAKFWLATSLQDLGRIDQADQIIGSTLAESREFVSPANIAFVYSRYGFTLIDRPAPIRQIERHLRETETICQGFRMGTGSSRCSLLRARLLGARGLHAEAVDAVERAIDQSRVDSASLVPNAYLRVLVRMCVRAGNFERAGEIVSRWNLDELPLGPPKRDRYRRTEAAILHLYKGEPERAYELVAPLVEAGGDRENRYSIHAACILVRAALATDRLPAARAALLRALSWQRTKLGELRFEILAVHLAYLEACKARGEDAAQGELSGVLNPSIANVRRAAKRHARKFDSQLDTNFWSENLARDWRG
ncbi:MAG: proteasome accessory factor PafA2 family protein [Deltaproteobacteria bacterium]|nr:proteasome accessory factor PafA2 family protein [Deltaproteobacteria bacterium]MBW2723339.1 proteasome accessory factor PafA2 family protein [Deltaproteobacteria bacterium]